MEIVQRTDVSFKITITDNSVPVNITGHTFYFTAKKQVTDSDDNAVIKKDWTTHIDPTNGITYLVLNHSDTDIPAGNYYYNIQYKSSDTLKTATSVGVLSVLVNNTQRG